MSLINSTAIPSGATYELEQSLRFNDPDSPELEKTFGTATNRKKWTWSGWYKVSLGHGNDSNPIVVTEDGQAQNTLITFGGHNAADDALSVIDWSSTAEKFQLVTTSLFRDPSAWYNIVVAYDSTQSTSSNRLKIYVNGEQVTVFTYSVYPPLNYESYLNSAVVTQIGHNASRSGHFHGYMAETNFIDGQQLTPANFGTTGTYGEWKPIEYSGTYGNNGFYLSFAGGGVMSATGGTITTDGDYKVNSFTSSGTFTPSADGYVEYLVIAGGGSGGGAPTRYGSGGGAGGYRTGYLPVTGSTGYTVTVGAGGVVSSNVADKGDNSVFGSITSTGGGRGLTTGSGANNYTTDINGGSGGGDGTYGQGSAGTGISGQGNNGGEGASGAASGGGGGAGGVGGNGGVAGAEIGGLGGAGLASSITGSSVTRAGGGGGGAWAGTNHAGSAGGSGGGGRGNGNGNAGTDGTANTGSGGGGGGYGHNGGDGGSGIVIIRYKFQ